MAGSGAVLEIENDFGWEGFGDNIVRSSILTVQRRLISTRKKHHNESGKDWGRGREKFELFLSDRIYRAKDRRRLVDLVEDAFRAANADISSHMKKKVFRRASELGWSCALCDAELRYPGTSSSHGKKSATLDHIWPRALGGNPKPPNLRVTCGDCNSKRQDATGLHDVDFPMIHYHSSSGVRFAKAFSRKYRICVAEEQLFGCARCNGSIRGEISPLRNLFRYGQTSLLDS